MFFLNSLIKLNTDFRPATEIETGGASQSKFNVYASEANIERQAII